MTALRALLLTLLVLGLLAVATAGPTTDQPVDLRLVHVTDGLRSMAPKGDLARLSETKIHKVAQAAGMDLSEPEHPFVQRGFANGRLFYVFYKTVENAFGGRPYLIQRIKKTERNWRAESAEPEIRVTYQVEVFKTLAGATKHPDQHYGSYSLGSYVRREIDKEYDIGFGEVPGLCEGETWPFSPKSLFRYLHRYAADKGCFDDVNWIASKHWTLKVALAKDGAWRVASPELGFDLPDQPTEPSEIVPRPIERSKGVVLTAGQGPEGLVVGESRPEDAAKVLGEPLEVMVFPAGTSSRTYPTGLTLFFEKQGTLRTAYTRPGFLGRTDKGAKHGDSRGRVMELLGTPRGQQSDAATWRYPGLIVSFDGFDQVSRVLTHAR